MRFVADMSIQMILGESTSLIAAVGFIQLYNFMYNRSDDIYIYIYFWTAMTLCYFKSHLFPVVKAKNTSGLIIDDISCWGLSQSFKGAVS